MNRTVKWILITGGALTLLFITALIVITQVVDVKQYKPRIENMVTEATGLPFSMGDDIKLSLFPWAGVSLSNLIIENPAGFKEKEMASIHSFQVKIKLLPLISRDIQVREFVVDGMKLNLEKRKDGTANWNYIAANSTNREKDSEKEADKKISDGKGNTPEQSDTESASSAFPIESLMVEELALKNSSLTFIDHESGQTKSVTDINLSLGDVTLDKPVKIVLSTLVDGQPLSIKGQAGPIGKEPGKGTLAFDFNVEALEQLKLKLKGEVTDPATSPQFNCDMIVSQFSPRALLSALKIQLPMEPSDAGVLNNTDLLLHIKGSPDKIVIENSVLGLDDSKLEF